MNGYVLAGGQGLRMGRDKALLPYEGSTLLEHALAALRAVCDEVAIAGSREDLSRFAPVIADEFAGCGPLAGIHAALRRSQSEWNLFLAVDMPRVGPEQLRSLLAHPRRPETVAVAAQAAGRLQPLCALYHRDLAGPMAAALAAGERSVTAFLEAAGRERGVERVAFADSGAFLNVNTPQEMATLAAVAPST